MEAKYTDKSLGKFTSSPSSSNLPASSPSTSTDPNGASTDPNGALEKKKKKKSVGYRMRSLGQKRNSLTVSVSRIAVSGPSARPIELAIVLGDQHPLLTLLTSYRRAGLTLTQVWNTANALESKVELADNLAKGLKAEGIFGILPSSSSRSAKLNLHFKQSAFHGRAFFDLLKGPTANIDAVVGHEGFLAGASAGYNVQNAAVTGYNAAVGYAAPSYSAAITATDNLSVFAASYYHKVNGQVEAGAKATWNSKSGNNVGLEVASKYRLDPVSFAKVRSCQRPPPDGIA